MTHGTGSPASQPVVYEIKVEGHPGHQWTDWLHGLIITLEDRGNTVLTSPIVDQATLYGLLKEVRDLGISWASIDQVSFNETYLEESTKK